MEKGQIVSSFYFKKSHCDQPKKLSAVSANIFINFQKDMEGCFITEHV